MNGGAPQVPVTALVPALVRCMRLEAVDVLSLELARVDGADWPPASAGAHLDLDVPGIGLRQYSLLPRQSPQVLHVGVQRDPHSRGGSRWVHETLRPGHTVHVGPLRNHFELDGGKGPVRLFAGGIGITPLLAMAHQLAAGPRDWQLHYAVRSRARAAFLPALTAHGSRVHLHVDDEAGHLLPLAAQVAAAPPGTHFYGCGPAPMLAAFADATHQIDPAQVHVEHFAAPAADPALPAGGFVVELARSGGRVVVAPGQSLLDALLAHGLAVPNSCRAGVCGSCETAVLAGTPDHRDVVLSPEERASGSTMMVCCSRAQGELLRLDL